MWHAVLPNSAVLVGTPHGVALLASARYRLASLQRNERIRRPFRTAGLKLFREGNLLSTQSLFAVDRGPGHGRVAAAQELLIDSFMATRQLPAVSLTDRTNP